MTTVADAADRDIRSFGAVADGTTVNTRALQAAIDARAAAGGGTVRIPSGDWVSGALAMRSDITLELDAGARLLGSQDLADYPPVRARLASFWIPKVTCSCRTSSKKKSPATSR